MTQVKGIEIVVEGRTFVQEPPTFEQEMYIMDQVMESGLDQIGKDLKLTDSDDLTRPVKLMITHAYRSGKLFHLLGALVTELGTEWTPEQAERNAALFRNTRDPSSKKALHPALVGSIIAFFESAANSATTSLTSLEDSPSSGVVSVRRKTTPEIAAEVFRSGSIPRPSKKSRTSTIRRSGKRSGGR